MVPVPQWSGHFAGKWKTSIESCVWMYIWLFVHVEQFQGERLVRNKR